MRDCSKDGINYIGILYEIIDRQEEQLEELGTRCENIAKDFDDLCAKALENSKRCFFIKKKFPKLSDIQKRMYLYFATCYEAGHTCFSFDNTEEGEEKNREKFGIGYEEIVDEIEALSHKTVHVLLGDKDAGRNFAGDCSLIFNSILIQKEFEMTDGKTAKGIAWLIEEPLLVQMMHNEIPRELWLPAAFNPEWRMPFKASVISELLEKYTYEDDAEDDTEEEE